MTKDFKLDDTGDLAMDDTSKDVLITTDDVTLLAQRIQSLLNTNLGELSWNEDYGISMPELMANYDDVDTLHQIIDEYLQDTLDGYSSLDIDSSSVDVGTRNLFIEATIHMENGTQVTTQIGSDTQ